MNRIRSTILSATAIAMLAGCGASDGGPTYTTKADSATMIILAGNANVLAGQTFIVAFLNGIPGIPLPPYEAPGSGHAGAKAYAYAYFDRLLAMTHLGPSLGPSRVAAPSLTAPVQVCNPTVTGVDDLGVPIDTDGDGVPDDFSVDFGNACVDEDSAGVTRYVTSGSFRLQDTDLGLYSFKIGVNHLKLATIDVASGDMSSTAVTGTETMSITAALGVHSLVYTQDDAVKSGGFVASAQQIENESSSFAPDSGGVLTPGSGVPAGNFEFNADYRLIGEHSGGLIPGNYRVALSTPTALHFDPACATQSGIDAGILRGLLSGKATIGFSYSWIGCGATTFEIFGDTPATTTAGS